MRPTQIVVSTSSFCGVTLVGPVGQSGTAVSGAQQSAVSRVLYKCVLEAITGPNGVGFPKDVVPLNELRTAIRGQLRLEARLH